MRKYINFPYTDSISFSFFFFRISTAVAKTKVGAMRESGGTMPMGGAYIVHGAT